MLSRILIIGIGILLVYEGVTGQTSNIGNNYSELEPSEFILQLKLADFPLIIDVREYEEFRKERIPKAVLAENRQVLEIIADSTDLDRPLFVYCSDNYRSPVACQILVKKGFVNVYNLAGGLIGWKETGLSTDREKLKKRKIR